MIVSLFFHHSKGAKIVTRLLRNTRSRKLSYEKCLVPKMLIAKFIPRKVLRNMRRINSCNSKIRTMFKQLGKMLRMI